MLEKILAVCRMIFSKEFVKNFYACVYVYIITA